MAYPLRQSTASQEVPLGPFLDDTDGKTPETGLTIAASDIRLTKHGGTTHVDKASGGATHDLLGVYFTTLDATDSNTLGGLVINVNVAGALPVRLECIVYPQWYFDAIWGGGSALPDSAGVATLLSRVTVAPAPASTALSSAVWTGTKAGYIDAAISSRSTYAGADTSGTTTLLSRITAAPPTAAAIATAVWANATRTLSTVGTFLDGIPAAVKSAIEAAGSHLALINAKTTNLPAIPASQSDVQVTVPEPVFGGTVEFTGTVEADMTPVVEAIAAIPAPTFSGTVNPPAVTIDPPVALTEEEHDQLMSLAGDEIAATVDELLTATHGSGTWGSESPDWFSLVPETLDDEGDALDLVADGGELVTGALVVASDSFGDFVNSAITTLGRYRLGVPKGGSTYTLSVKYPGVEWPERTVTVE